MNLTKLTHSYHIGVAEKEANKAKNLANTRFKVNKNGVIDYPIHYNTSPDSIVYDYPESIPQFVKNKVAALYDRFPVLKCENKND